MAEPKKPKEQRTAVSINAQTRKWLSQIRSAYLLESWDEAVLFLLKNMKPVERPKLSFLDK